MIGQLDTSVPGTANYQPGGAPDYRALIAQAMAQQPAPAPAAPAAMPAPAPAPAAGGGAWDGVDHSVAGTRNYIPGWTPPTGARGFGGGGSPFNAPQYPGPQGEEVTSDPATEGFTQEGSTLTGFMGPETGMAQSTAQSNQDTGFGSTLGAGILGGFAPGTGLGMAQHGYNSSYGTQADAFNQDADAVTAAIADVMGYSNEVNDAVNGLGYAPGTLAPGTPSPSTPGDLAGYGLVSSPASLSTDTGLSSPGFDAGPGVSADQGGANDSGGGAGGDGGK